MFSPPKFEDCKISEVDEIKTAISGDGCLIVNPDGETKVFMRNGIKKHLQLGETQKVRWLVGELNGVRCYYDGESVVMSTQDLYP